MDGCPPFSVGVGLAGASAPEELLKFAPGMVHSSAISYHFTIVIWLRFCPCQKGTKQLTWGQTWRLGA